MDKSLESIHRKTGTARKKSGKISHVDTSHSHRLLARVLPIVTALITEQTSKKGEVLTLKDTLISGRVASEPDTDNVLSLRALARGMFSGDKTYRFYVGSNGQLNVDGTLGVFVYNISFNGDITASNNWNSLAAIFDEFAYVKSHYQLVPISGGFNVASPGATLIAADDDGIGSAATIISGGYGFMMSYPTVKVFCPAVQGATLATEANSTGFAPMHYTHSRPYPTSASPMVDDPTTGWCDCATPTNLLGSILLYNAAVSTTNNTPVYWYFAQLEVAFRLVR